MRWDERKLKRNERKEKKLKRIRCFFGRVNDKQIESRSRVNKQGFSEIFSRFHLQSSHWFLCNHWSSTTTRKDWREISSLHCEMWKAHNFFFHFVFVEKLLVVNQFLWHSIAFRIRRKNLLREFYTTTFCTCDAQPNDALCDSLHHISMSQEEEKKIFFCSIDSRNTHR